MDLSDIFFACVRGGEQCRAALRHLQTSHLEEFTQALRKLATNTGKDTPSPVELPFMSIQSLWIRENPYALTAITNLPLASEATRWSQLEALIIASASAFHRVLKLVRRAAMFEAGGETTRHLAVLADVAAMRPLVFIVSEHEERHLRALSVVPKQQEWNEPKVAYATDALRVRCARLRIDAVESMYNEPVSGSEASDIVVRFTQLSVDTQNAAYMIPPGCGLLHECSPLDISHCAVAEERRIPISARVQGTSFRPSLCPLLSHGHFSYPGVDGHAHRDARCVHCLLRF